MRKIWPVIGCLPSILLLTGCGVATGKADDAAEPAVHMTQPACKSAITGRRVALAADGVGFGSGIEPSSLQLRPKEYVLTIDDGPRPDRLPEILAILREHCVRATFFLVGKRALAQGELVQRILREGHSIASHSWDHPDMTGWPEEAIEQTMMRGADAVEAAAWQGDPPAGRMRLIRQPSRGWVTPDPPFLAFMRKHHFQLANVDLTPEDWRDNPPAQSYRRLFSQRKDRGVIVLHDGPRNTPELLRMILQRFREDGARVVALDLPGAQAIDASGHEPNGQ